MRGSPLRPPQDKNRNQVRLAPPLFSLFPNKKRVRQEKLPTGAREATDNWTKGKIDGEQTTQREHQTGSV